MIKKLIQRMTFWKLVLATIFLMGLYISYVRFFKGLGASTGLSDKFPWGLWVGFDVLCGVGLAAGGFTITLVVHVFNLKKYKPILPATVLSAFLGYLLVNAGLLFDIGRPYRVWHPLIMWNPHSVMFEVAWCVMLYTAVLSMEFSPLVFERLNWEKPKKIVKSITIPLVILGFILSSLHQSSLGTVFLIVPGRLHPLWYSPILPLMFFTSAIATGLSMVIFESYLSRRAFKKRLELDLLSGLGRVICVVLAVYFVLKMKDLYNRGALAFLLDGSHESKMFALEMVFGVVVPLILFSQRKVRESQGGLFIASLMVVLGFVINRLNVSITGMLRSSGVNYFPSWMEIGATVFLVAVGFALFAAAVKYLPVFPKEEANAEREFAYLTPKRANSIGSLTAEAEAKP
ncbi:MAG: Ni/Fe-hydrogenase cytochrome b subunit [Candidatus Abyssobacteria bacterium SURF_17]|uniref:Ni/Fe-hydrogenase cytochrome b subunit n=1 Tax=Candidatus Abyssobacteria bacterium SURF_17 TaxID=2093361 RepID=A0A419EQ04_9BACT|nr:MAG: Ni/Fe-hydrogenase cytochrome b subunit [Candidatus Abyssubacteria bacterium SURF_17]